ncbi:MAG TPA: hypothetical protein VMG60_24060 [Burkholderiaceae bacterium]|nr:hypothetical protein [Burkholderiaceae bacterium]
MSHRSPLRRQWLRTRGGALLACALIVTPLAAGATATTAAATAAMSIPEQQYHGIAYATGGITPEEAAAFRAETDKYPLALEIVEKQAADKKRDEFTASAKVQIKRGDKTVFDSAAAGPFMLVRLDPGVYSITATLGTHTLHKMHVHVAAGRTAHELFEFPVHSD